MTTHLSVTEIRNALRCPRAFALGRAQGAQVMFPLGASSLGSAFHRIVETFARSLAARTSALTEPTPAATPEEVQQLLVGWIIELLIRELEQSPTYLSMPSEVDDLAEALRNFVAYVVREAVTGGEPPLAAVRRFVGNAEVEVEVVYPLDDASAVVVAGRADALHEPPRGLAQVVEYKLTDEANEPIDRVQVALYRDLLRRSAGVETDAVILRFNPHLHRTTLSADDADALVRDEVLPLLWRMTAWANTPAGAPPTARRDLCAVCPLRAPCAAVYADQLAVRDDPPASAQRPRPEPSGELRSPAPAAAPEAPAPAPGGDEAGHDDAKALRAMVLAALAESGVQAESPPTPLVGARLVRIDVSARRGRVTALDRVAREDVIHQLHARHGRVAQFQKEGGLRYFMVERAAPRVVHLRELLERAGPALAAQPGRFVIGERLDGSVLVGDLSDPSSCHLLVAGTTGSGKSVLLRSIAASLVHYHPPSAIRLTLVDPKRVSFGKLAPLLSAHLASPLCHDVEEALPILGDLVGEMEERYRILAEARVQDIDELHAATGDAERLPRHVVLVDEFQDMLASKATRTELVGVVRKLGAKARAAGIHLVLATQRPTKENVPTEVKANLPGRIALRTTSGLESSVVLDETGAEELLGRGDLLAKVAAGTTRAQAPLD